MNWGLLALALAPGAAIAFYIYLHDRYEKEPLWLLLRCFLLGALVTVPVLYANIWWRDMGFGMYGSIFETAFYAFISVAGTEELAKFLVTFFFAYLNRAFNEPYDGIVYSVMTAMGFASAENLMYIFQADEAEAQWIGLVRMFTAVPAHATFAILMGFFMGLAKFSTWEKPLLLGAALLTALLFHGAYDFFLFLQHIPLISFGAIVSLVIGIVVSMRVMRINQLLSPFRYRDEPEEA